jgi:hypothetical protein
MGLPCSRYDAHKLAATTANIHLCGWFSPLAPLRIFRRHTALVRDRIP